MTLSFDFPRRPEPGASTAAWLPVICPVCHLVARALPAGRTAMAIACQSCGHYRLSCMAAKIFDAQPASTDRAELSEAVQDACLMAECDWPLIDGITASTLTSLPGLPRPSRAASRHANEGACT